MDLAILSLFFSLSLTFFLVFYCGCSLFLSRLSMGMKVILNPIAATIYIFCVCVCVDGIISLLSLSLPLSPSLPLSLSLSLCPLPPWVTVGECVWILQTLWDKRKQLGSASLFTYNHPADHRLHSLTHFSPTRPYSSRWCGIRLAITNTTPKYRTVCHSPSPCLHLSNTMNNGWKRNSTQRLSKVYGISVSSFFNAVWEEMYSQAC